MRLSFINISACLAAMLTVGCTDNGNQLGIPRSILLGEAPEIIRPLLEKDCSASEQFHYTAEMAAPFEDQLQIDCFGLPAFGRKRDAEFMFNDGPLGHVWVHIDAKEIPSFESALAKEFGPSVENIDNHAVFNCAEIAIRFEPPELLIASPRLIAAIAGVDYDGDC